MRAEKDHDPLRDRLRIRAVVTAHLESHGVSYGLPEHRAQLRSPALDHPQGLIWMLASEALREPVGQGPRDVSDRSPRVEQLAEGLLTLCPVQPLQASGMPPCKEPCCHRLPEG